jgi:hypothetical protein
MEQHIDAVLYIILTLHGAPTIRQKNYEDVAVCKVDAAHYNDKRIGLAWCTPTRRMIIAH